jgi:hypothetical protein
MGRRVGQPEARPVSVEGLRQRQSALRRALWTTVALDDPIRLRRPPCTGSDAPLFSSARSEASRSGAAAPKPGMVQKRVHLVQWAYLHALEKAWE